MNKVKKIKSYWIRNRVLHIWKWGMAKNRYYALRRRLKKEGLID